MVKLSVVDEQLKAVGCTIRYWGRAEIKELCEVLLPGETIAQAVNGQYEGGWALLVSTDFRVLLIDKKPKYLTLKDIRFDMITELDFNNRMLNSTIHIFTPNRELKFTAINGARLRRLFTHTQHKVMEIRNHFMMQQFQQQHQAKNTPPGLAMTMQRYGQSYDAHGGFEQSQEPPVHFYQPQQQAAMHQVSHDASGPAQSSAAASGQTAHDFQHHDSQQHGSQHHDTSDEQRKLAIAMGAAGLRSIVHNGKVIKDYMAVPFTQRWRKRPYGYTSQSVQRPTAPSAS